MTLKSFSTRVRSNINPVEVTSSVSSPERERGAQSNVSIHHGNNLAGAEMKEPGFANGRGHLARLERKSGTERRMHCISKPRCDQISSDVKILNPRLIVNLDMEPSPLPNAGLDPRVETMGRISSC